MHIAGGVIIRAPLRFSIVSKRKRIKNSHEVHEDALHLIAVRVRIPAPDLPLYEGQQAACLLVATARGRI